MAESLSFFDGVGLDQHSGVEKPRSCLVRFEPSGRSIRVEAGTLLLDAARQAGLHVAQSCGGMAICSWCKMELVDGMQGLSAIQPCEARLIRRESFRPGERASCQAEVEGDVTVTTAYW